MFCPLWMRARIESASTCPKPCISVAVYGEYTKRALLMTVWNLAMVTFGGMARDASAQASVITSVESEHP